MTEYKILESNNSAFLESQVNLLLEQGWILGGQLTTTVYSKTNVSYHQPMIKIGVSDHEKYMELIMAVGTKHPNQTRHETALMYIINAEKNRCSGMGAVEKASKNK